MLAAKQFKNSCFLLATLLLILVVSPSHASSNLEPVAAAGQKVNLALYYESLCPYCANFIVNQLVNVFNKGLNSIVNLRLVPWGNAVVAQNGTVVCQHGPNECKLNTIEACVIKIWPDVSMHFKYINCMERLLIERSNKDLKSCYATAGDWNTVEQCSQSGLGSQLEQQYRAETDSLKPPHEYVPWVVVNNQPIKDDYENFIKYVCKAYKGQLPDACKSPTLEFNSAEKKNMTNQVSFVVDVKTLTHSITVKGTSQRRRFRASMKTKT